MIHQHDDPLDTSRDIDEIALLAQVSQLLTALDAEATLDRVVTLAAEICGGERASLIVRRDSGYDHFSDRGRVEDPDLLRVVLESGLAGWVLRHGQSALIDDTDRDPRWYQSSHDYHARSAMSVPLVLSDAVIGVVSVAHSRHSAFNAQKLRLLTILANQAATAITHAFTVERLSQQEARLRAIVQAVPDPFFVLDADGAVLMASDAAQAFVSAYNLDPAALHIDDLARYDAAFKAIQDLIRQRRRDSDPAQPNANWSFEVQSSVHQRDYLANISTWTDTQESLPGYVIVLRDVTALRDVTRFKDQLISLLSHDLRSPLVLIMGYAALFGDDLRAGRDIDTLIQYADVIVESASQMDQMLEALIDMDRARSSLHNQAELLDLGALVRMATANQQMHAQTHHITLTYEPPADGAPLMLSGASYLLARALENLISNAIKYTHPGGQVSVSLEALPGRARVTVTDTGIGIAPEDLPRVFDPFFRGDNGKGKARGTGLGLSLVRQIITQHGGQVGVESELGRGSRFWVVLPLLDEDATQVG